MTEVLYFLILLVVSCVLVLIILFTFNVEKLFLNNNLKNKKKQTNERTSKKDNLRVNQAWYDLKHGAKILEDKAQIKSKPKRAYKKKKKKPIKKKKDE